MTEPNEDIEPYALVLVHQIRERIVQGADFLAAFSEAEAAVREPLPGAASDRVFELAKRLARPSLPALLQHEGVDGQVALLDRVTAVLLKESGLDLAEELLRWRCEILARKVALDDQGRVFAAKDPSLGVDLYRAVVVARRNGSFCDWTWQAGATRKAALEQLLRELEHREGSGT